MLKVYCWLTICHTKWRLQGSTMLTYFGNCASQLKRSSEESWPMYPCFCTHVGQAAVLECGFEEMRHPPYSPDLAPRDYHLFPNLKKHLHGQRFSWTEIFDPRWAQVCNRRVVEGAVGTVLFYPSMVTNCALTKAVTMLKNKCMLIRLPFI